jgi:hypothetical protein
MRTRKWPFEQLTSASYEGSHRLHRAPAGPLDPAEKWELPYCDGKGRSYYRSVHNAFPYTPRRTEDIPAGALESLHRACGVQGLHQLFIIPSAVRSVGWKDQKVISPKSILALGSRAAGLWTEEPTAGVKVVIELEKLSAIEDEMILLYGRLRFHSSGDDLTVRYNTLARRNLEPALLVLRRRLGGHREPVLQEGDGTETLPFKWMHIVCSARIHLHKGAPVAYRFATVPGKSRYDIERAQLLVLNPHELIYLCDPVETSHPYGEDSFIIPRARISAVRIGEESTGFTSNGIHFSLPMASELRQGAARWLL